MGLVRGAVSQTGMVHWSRMRATLGRGIAWMSCALVARRACVEGAILHIEVEACTTMRSQGLTVLSKQGPTNEALGGWSAVRRPSPGSVQIVKDRGVIGGGRCRGGAAELSSSSFSPPLLPRRRLLLLLLPIAVQRLVDPLLDAVDDSKCALCALPVL